MKEFSKSTTPQGYYNFIAEVTDSQVNPKYFNKAEINKENVISELKDIGFLKNKMDVEDIRINAVRDTYPVYHKEYKLAFNKVIKIVKKFSKNIYLLGRSGAYWYNNSDHSIRMAIEMSKKMLRNTEKEFDFRKYF